MVYLKEILKRNKELLFKSNNIELIAYLYINSKEQINYYEFDLTPEEQIASCGYKDLPVDHDIFNKIITRAPIKGISATTNIYKFAGLYLVDKITLKDKLIEKYRSSDFKQKYFLTKIEPELIDFIYKDLNENISDDFITIIKKIFNYNISEDILNNSLNNIVNKEIDVQIQIILEDYQRKLLNVNLLNKNAEELIKQILLNFSNSTQKILNRRKNHDNYKIIDEYDVQDILYVILKSIFPNLRDEDPIPKVGSKSTKIDLILREEEILIEVKMIKENDKNETNFIEELKADFESYHACQWLKKLYCFVYDPFKKTKDLSNFKDLNGDRIKNEHKFNVEVIVVN